MEFLGDVYCIQCGTELEFLGDDVEYYSCCAIGCPNSRKKIPISNSDNDVNLNCALCGSMLEQPEDLELDLTYDDANYYTQTVKVACTNIPCSSFGVPEYLNVLDFEQSDDYCEVCGEQMVEYDNIDLSNIIRGDDEVELCSVTEFLHNSYNNSPYKYRMPRVNVRLVEEEEEEVYYPTVFMSEGLG